MNSETELYSRGLNHSGKSQLYTFKTLSKLTLGSIKILPAVMQKGFIIRKVFKVVPKQRFIFQQTRRESQSVIRLSERVIPKLLEKQILIDAAVFANVAIIFEKEEIVKVQFIAEGHLRRAEALLVVQLFRAYVIEFKLEPNFLVEFEFGVHVLHHCGKPLVLY